MENLAQGLNFIAKVLESQVLRETCLQFGQKYFKINSNQLRLLASTSVREYFIKQNTLIIFEESDRYLTGLVRKEEHWHPNEFKIFTWVVISHFFSKQRSLQQNLQLATFQNFYDQPYFSGLFPSKSKVFIQYSIRTLLKKDQKSVREWQKEEERLLVDIITSNEFGRRWSDIAYILYLRSDRAFFKSLHQCREKWFNHLNPTLKKEKWSLEEDVTLFRLAKELDTKWAMIAREMGQYRTDHMVKNRFKSILKRYESRFVRCTLRKRIENILKDLEKKLIQQEKEMNCDFSNQTEQSNDKRTHIIPYQIVPDAKEQFNWKNQEGTEINLQDWLEIQEVNSFILNVKEGCVLIDYTNMDFQDFEANRKTIFSDSQ